MATSKRIRGDIRLLLLLLLKTPFQVGGQAVLEGVMMRSPGALAIVVRRPDGTLAIRKGPWQSISERIPILKRPFLRGVVVLVEALINGIQALNFSAQQAASGQKDQEELSGFAIAGTMALSLALALGLFVVFPHVLSAFLLKQLGDASGVSSFWFHAIDGIIKMALFLGYVYAIGRLKDIKRVFQYHGAEHKSIYTFEAGMPLTVEKARGFSTLHPRCGTAFIMVVLMVSIGLFAIVLPLLPLPHIGIYGNFFMIIAKLFLMLPIAGISYEIIRWAGSRQTDALVRYLILPGLLMQKITTRAPTDDQLEVALEALRQALSLEPLQKGRV